MVLRLCIRAGPSMDCLEEIACNNDASPVILNSDHLTARLCVRIASYHGATPGEETSPYFPHSSDLYSIQLQCRFKQKMTADDIVFGNSFDQKLRLPYGSSVAVKFAQWFDPGLKMDLFSDRPWAFSPLFETMNRMSLDEDAVVDQFPAVNRQDDPNQHIISSPGASDMLALPDWPSPLGEPIQEHFPAKLLPSIDSSIAVQRRKVMNNANHRASLDISPDQVWNMDFCNAFIDFDKFQIKLPGFGVDVLKYWDGQPLHYVAKSKDNGMTFFVVEFTVRDMMDTEVERMRSGQRSGQAEETVD
ncbi:hypothetical protein BZG36_01421 [Bifiguratus adelaidae]|uniref:Domain of unknown function at the cortex 1 domain-containing protein n=1 Tax=Bifiguratus adelaidae TaxID=1938954 RepID=A0A261Y525_9FUNG|nr:hypothetical protein BZG36_01421 [Bifiguratus adelaidae]